MKITRPIRVLPKYKTLPRALNAVCSFYVGLFRGTPMVVQLLIFYYVMLPLMGIKLPGVRVAMVVFGLNSGAYISEIMRSGIQSVDPGQLEAGRAVGLGFGPAMIRIVIPQAVKNILPAMGNEFIQLIKETSILGYVGIVDLTKAASYVSSRTYQMFIPLLAAGIVYYLIVKVLSILLGKFERRLKESD